MLSKLDQSLLPLSQRPDCENYRRQLVKALVNDALDEKKRQGWTDKETLKWVKKRLK